MKDTKRVREGAPEFEPKNEELENEEGFEGEGEPEGEEFEFEGEPEGEEEFDGEEDFEDEGIEAGEITIDGKRYCVVLYEIEDDEEAEEEAEGETPEEEAEEGEEEQVCACYGEG